MDNAIKVFVKNGDKEINIELDHVDEYQKLFIIHNVFSVFGIDTDLLESYQQVEKMYQMFHKEMGYDRERTKPTKEINPEQIKHQMEEGYKTFKVGDGEEYHDGDLHKNDVYKGRGSTISERLDAKSGIQYIHDAPHYQLFYSCPNQSCRKDRKHRSKMFIPLHTKKIECQSCFEEMEVQSAHPSGFPRRDTFGNYFVAGVFKDYDLDWSH